MVLKFVLKYNEMKPWLTTSVQLKGTEDDTAPCWGYV